MTAPNLLHPTWLEVDCQAIAANTRAVLSRTRAGLMAVIKANAYGLGAPQVARTVLSAGAAWLAVARAGEAFILRENGIPAPLLVFGMLAPGEIDRALGEQVSLTLYSPEQLPLLAARSAAAGRPARVHLKIDTGFGRLGILPDEAVALAQAAEKSGLVIEGVYSHLAMADEIPDHPHTRLQIERFEQVLGALASAGIHPPLRHLANSAAAFGLAETHYDLVRVGSALIGLKPFYFAPLPDGLRRVVTWKALLASCRRVPAGWAIGYGQTYIPQQPEYIGTLPVGYGDGFRRQPGNEVLIDGQRVPVVGRVCNDMCMVRLPRAYPIGTEIVLVGRQGAEEINTDELVDRWKTSQADTLSGISLRVPRVYR